VSAADLRSRPVAGDGAQDETDNPSAREINTLTVLRAGRWPPNQLVFLTPTTLHAVMSATGRVHNYYYFSATRLRNLRDPHDLKI